MDTLARSTNQSLSALNAAAAKKSCVFAEDCQRRFQGLCPQPDLSACGQFIGLLEARCAACEMQKKLSVKLSSGRWQILNADLLQIVVLKPILDNLPREICQNCHNSWHSRCACCARKKVTKIYIDSSWLIININPLTQSPINNLLESLSVTICPECRNSHKNTP